MLKWRSTCPDVLLTRIEEAVEARFYMLRQTGPTGFLVKEHDSDKKFKVYLGSIHSCDCAVFLKEKELCMHLLWILIKKFRLDKNNQVVYQLGLCERELNNVVYGKKETERKVVKTTSAGGADRDILKQKTLDVDDVCPICQEDIFKNKKGLTYCRFGCGNSIHVKCMKIWADHQFKSTDDEVIKCPLCRTEFANYKTIVQEYNKAVTRKKSKQKKSEIVCKCKKCNSQILVDQSFRCAICSNYWLCSKCFQTNYHSEHNFEFKKSPKERWNLASRPKEEFCLMPSISNFNLPERSTSKGEERQLSHDIRQRRRNTISKFRSNSSSRADSQPDLRSLGLGISGYQQKDKKEIIRTSIRHTDRNSPNACLPPLPTNKALVSNGTRLLNNERKKNSASEKRTKEISIDFSKMVLVSSPLVLNANVHE